MRDREPFKSIWRQLPSGERREVLRLALRGKPAPDSFKAWLVVEFTTSKLTPRTFIPVFLALSVDVIVGAFAWLANSRVAWVPIVLVSLCASMIALVVWRYRRARKLNQPLLEGGVFVRS